MEHKDDIEKYIKSSLNQLDMSPDDMVWERISNTLVAKRRKRRRMMLLSLFFAVFFLNIIGILWVMNWENKTLLMPNIKETVLPDANTKPSLSNVNQDQNNDINTLEPMVSSQIIDTSNTSVVVQEVSVQEYVYQKTASKVKISQSAKNSNYDDQIDSKSNLEDSNNTLKSRIQGVTHTQKSNFSDDFEHQDMVVMDTILGENIPQFTYTVTLLEEEDTTESYKLGKLKRTISVVAAPTLMSSFNSNSIIDKQLSKAKDQSSLKWSFGGYYNFELHKKWGFRMGVLYTQGSIVTRGIPVLNGNQTSPNSFHIYSNLRLKSGIDNDMIAGYFSNSQNIDLISTVSFFEIPLDMCYRVIDRKINVDIYIGFTTQVSQNNKVLAKDTMGNTLHIGSLEQVTPLAFGLNSGLMFTYPLSNQIGIVMNPGFNYQLSRNNFSFLTLQTGLYFKFE